MYCCPRCRGDVEALAERYFCGACSASYPIVAGIPDFRVFPDPYIGLAEDRAKAQRLHEHAKHATLAELVEYYFSITPDVSSKLARSYTAGMLVTGPGRARSSLQFLERVAGERPGNARVIEIGTGSGPYLGALAERFENVTAVDIAMRWLVVARKRLLESGLHAELVCACAEHLPFRDASFDVTLAANVIEHLTAPTSMLAETWRVLDDAGVVLLETPNRTSPRPDPHFGIWGLGLLPRSWRTVLARWLRGEESDRVTTRSYFELRELLEGSEFERIEIAIPELPTSSLDGPMKVAAHLHNLVRDIPGLRGTLYLVGPAFEVLAFKARTRGKRGPRG